MLETRKEHLEGEEEEHILYSLLKNENVNEVKRDGNVKVKGYKHN